MNSIQAICKSKKATLTHISLNILSDDRTKQQVASQLLKEMKDGNTTAGLIKQSILCTPMTVNHVSSSKVASDKQLSVADVISIQLRADLTDRQLFQILKDPRANFGRKTIHSHVKKTLMERKTSFSDLVTKEITMFENSKGDAVSRPFVFCHDLDQLIGSVVLDRVLRFTKPWQNHGKRRRV